MTPEDWQGIKHFTPQENWGSPEKMNPRLLRALDRYREVAGTSIVVTCGTQGTHSEKSEHPKGNAVDIVFPNLFLPRLLDMFLLATRFDEFDGIGVYPHWRLNGVIHGGLHLDVREVKIRAYWMGVPAINGQKYVALSAANLKTYGLI